MFQDGHSHSMQEDYDSAIDYSNLLRTCLETLWLTEDHHFQQRFHICQHILEDSLEIDGHETPFVDNFPSSYRQIDISCEPLGSTIASHVQPKALLNMG